eukprot:4747550-Alexandrium_andersonii.AAC.1
MRVRVLALVSLHISLRLCLRLRLHLALVLRMSLPLSWIQNRRETASRHPATLTTRTRGPSSDSEPARNRLPDPRLPGRGRAAAGAREDSC